MPTDLKKKLMDTRLHPSITYVCQTKKYMLRMRNKIRSYQRNTEERSVTNVRGRPATPWENNI